MVINSPNPHPGPSQAAPTQITDEPRFLVNLHALHNAHLIHKVLLHELTRPIPILGDEATCAKKHSEWAKGLQVSRPLKWQAVKDKAAAT
jgi:hypothetical protein